jgi:hypothetical protein
MTMTMTMTTTDASGGDVVATLSRRPLDTSAGGRVA